MRCLVSLLVILIGCSQSLGAMKAPRGGGVAEVAATCDNTTDAVLDGISSGTTAENNLSATKYVSQAVSLNSGEIVTGYQTTVQASCWGTSSMSISLWTNNSGQPGSLISGTTITATCASLPGSFGTAELLLASNYSVTSTGTYHIVIGGTGTDGVYSVYYDTTTLAASNYTTDSGATWYSDSAKDFRVEVLGCD